MATKRTSRGSRGSRRVTQTERSMERLLLSYVNEGNLVQLGMMEGLWSGDTPLTVDDATFDVKVVQPHGSGDLRGAPKRSSRRSSRRR
jgi:hypothetical protein